MIVIYLLEGLIVGIIITLMLYLYSMEQSKSEEEKIRISQITAMVLNVFFIFMIIILFSWALMGLIY